MQQARALLDEVVNAIRPASVGGVTLGREIEEHLSGLIE
jgi:hypothetical protein